METNARYLTVGAFTLALLVAMFGFVLWLNRTGGLAQRETYVVRFSDSVSGLQPGAAVLFDGVRVGEVSGLSLDSNDPNQVLVKIAVLAGTPLRADTHVTVEAQGLTGTVAVMLEGGDRTAPRLVGTDGQPAVLTAPRGAGTTLTQASREALQRVNTILGDNAASLKDTIDNLKTFSGALARNSDRVDSILAGLQRMTSNETPKPPPIFDLATPVLPHRTTPAPSGQIVIADPTAVLALQTQRLLVRSPDGRIEPTGVTQWSDTLPKLVQEKILQSFEDAGLAASIGPATDHAPDDRELRIDLRRFDLASGASPAAEVAFAATLVGSDGHIVKTRVFEATVPCTTGDDPSAVTAIGAAFSKAVSDLAGWLAAP